MNSLSVTFLMTLSLAWGPGWSMVNADCLTNLKAADSDSNMQLTSSEYVSFLSLESDDRLELSSFSGLPLSLVAPFHYGACSCALTSTDDQCCVGESASIDLDPAVSSTGEDTLITFCRAVGNAIDSLLPETATPTTAPTGTTLRPTAANELCLTFQLGLNNNAGFDADDIFNMVGNTFKTGLIAATETITIEALNATSTAGRRLRYRGVETLPHVHGKKVMHVVPLESSDSKSQNDLVLNGLSKQGQQRVLGRRGGTSSTITRRLATYSKSLPPVVLSVIDNNVCDVEEITNCLIASIETCVFLEEGDIRWTIRNDLSMAIRISIANGEFEDAIPEEHLLG